jgi:hypothetical protein
MSLLISFIIFLPFFRITRNPEKIRLGKVLDSQNLFVKLENNSNNRSNDQFDIFFMAHLDSKGQRITARTRGICIFLLTISLVSNTIILVLRSLIPILYILFTAIGIVPLLILLIAVIILSTNTTNNKSKGVIDDASGIACILELLHYFSKQDISNKKYNLWFLFTGAEESGTMGIRYFYKLIHQKERDKVIVHNFESLGKTIVIQIAKNSLKNHEEYINFIQKRAEDKGFTIFVNPLTRGIHTDGMYLAQRDFSLFEYSSSEVGKYMHSEFDSLENVDTGMLKNLCDFIVSTINSFF